MTKKLTIINIVLTCLVAILLVANLVQLVLLPEKIKNVVSTDGQSATVSLENESQSRSDLEETETNLQQNDTIPMTEIETPYCTLKYPTEYYEYLKLVENDENGVFFQTYYCIFNGMETELFTVSFGDKDAEMCLGYLNNVGEQILVGISFNNLARDESWSDEEYFTVCAMQEAVNDVILSITSCQTFNESN